MFFLSGAAGLVYEVLWMKQLTDLFGGTAQSAAASNAAFFLGIAGGSFFWGSVCAPRPNPLRTYAVLELAIVITALAFLLLNDLWVQLFSVFYASFAESPALIVAGKLALSMLLICPSTFLRGGTRPVFGQYFFSEAS